MYGLQFVLYGSICITKKVFCICRKTAGPISTSLTNHDILKKSLWNDHIRGGRRHQNEPKHVIRSNCSVNKAKKSIGL